MQLSIELKGVNELMAQLNTAEKGIVTKMMRKGMRAAAKPILATAKRLCPYSGRKQYDIKTGKRRIDNYKKMKVHLRDLLVIRAMKRRKGRIGVLIGMSSKGDGFYGSFLELGTVKMPAHPFLRPAFDSNREETEAILKSELDAALVTALAASGRMGEGDGGVMPVLTGEVE